MERISEELNVSYAWFRKSFKAHTGIAPNQVILYLSTMLSDCGWTTQTNTPISFKKEIKQSTEISRILWGYISSNLTRMQKFMLV